MQKTYRTYLEYKEMRRRIEAQLHKPRTVLIHTYLFLIVNVVVWLAAYPAFYPIMSGGDVFVPGIMTVVWSFGLLIHTFLSYFYSGLSPDRRETAIESEMNIYLQSQDLETDEPALFRMHRMLDDDIRQRAGHLFSLSMFAFVNVIAWAIWLIGGANAFGNEIWMTVSFAVYIFVIGGGALNFWRSNQREKKRTQVHDDQPSAYSRPRYFATAEHERLEIVDDDTSFFEKRKR